MSIVDRIFDVSTLFAAFIVLAFFYIMVRYRKKPVYTPLMIDLAYDYVSEPFDTPNRELLESFAGMKSAKRRGAQLIRFALFNRGTLKIEAESYLRPIRIEFPEGSRILEARFSERVNGEDEQPPEPVIDGATAEILPFPMPQNSVAVFNFVVRGAEKPASVDTGVQGQDGIYRLGI